MSNHSIFFNLDKWYIEDSLILFDIKFKLEAGEIISIVGESGVGKTQLLKSFYSHYIKDFNASFVFQEDLLFPWLNVLENLKLVSSDDEFILKTLEEFNLGNVVEMYPKELSGGMKQRINLLRALLNHPRVVLLDEPFSSLDYLSRKKMLKFTINLLGQRKQAALFVTHDLDEAIEISDTLLILKGRPATISSVFETKNISEQDSLELRKLVMLEIER